MTGRFQLASVISTSQTGFAALRQDSDLRAAFASLRSQGYSGAELAVRDPALVDRPALRAALAETGLVVPAIGTGQAYVDEHLSLTDPDSKVRQRASDRLRSQMEFATEFGANIIVGLIRGGKEGDLDRRRGFFAEALAELAPAFPGTVLIEPMNRYECSLLCNVAEMSEFLDEVALPNVGILFDTFHANIEEADIPSSLVGARGKLRHIHFADSNRRFPGAGHFDFAGTLRMLEAVDYRGWISMETLPWPDPETAAGKAAKHISNLIKNME